MSDERFDVTLAGGRTVDVWASGPDGEIPLVFHHGTPMSGLPYARLSTIAADRGIRWISYSRPGYGGSSRAEGRSVADGAADTAGVLDHLGVDRALALGWSGGGPHALATAALLPERTMACATIAGAAPYGMPDLDFLADMGQENIEEFGAAIEGVEPLRSYLEAEAAALSGAGPDDIAGALGDLIPDVDRSSLTGDFAAYMADAMHEALRSGIWGWFDDDLAFVRDWGFELASIRVPTTIWQGDLDRMVPFAHGRWLAGNVPGSTSRLLEGDGHLSIVIGRFGEILDGLLAPVTG